MPCNSPKLKRLNESMERIVEQYVGGATTEEIAEQYHVSKSYLERAMKLWREWGCLPYLNRAQLDDDQELITHLYREGVPIRELAAKWECVYETMYRALIRWGAHTPKGKIHLNDDTEKMTFEAARSNWRDINEAVVITVSAESKFLLVPIGD